MKRPKVSVIVPCYNHRRFLTERLESIFAQTFRDFEILILDDASTDGSHNVLARYYNKPKVRLFVNTKNTGSAFPQWNRGINLAKGEYIWIAESDDSAKPDFLETLVPVLDEDPSVGLVYCKSILIDREGKEFGTSLPWTEDLHPNRWGSDFCNLGVDEVRKYLVIKNTIPNASAVLLRRSFILETLPVDSSFKLCGDWLHWGKVLFRSNISYKATGLNFWRINSSNSRTRPPGVLEWKEGQRIIRYFGKRLDLSQPEIFPMLLRFADNCLGWLEASQSAN